MESKEFVKRFRKIKLKYICKNLNINYSNILNGRASEKCFDRLKNELDKKIILLYKDDDNE